MGGLGFPPDRLSDSLSIPDHEASGVAAVISLIVCRFFS